MRIVCLVLALAACGRPATTSAPKERGGHGAVCQCGERSADRSGESCHPLECADGLVCAYGCGIPGCDSTCMTPDEAERAHLIP
jgi:hypothetical protein